MKSDVLDDWLLDTGVAVLARDAHGEFEFVGPVPEFFTDMAHAEGLDADRAARRPHVWSPFLENFLVDAGEFWKRATPGRLLSGPWSETTRAGRTWELEAAAVWLSNGRQLLVIQHVREEYTERVAVLQKARTAGLEYDRLQREVQEKEVLLHCVVHDLKAPLANIHGSLSLIKSGKLSAERELEMLEVGIGEARRQESMIKQLLDVFRAEVQALASFDSQPGRAPDLRQCSRVAARAMLPGFERRGVELRLASDLALEERLEVHGRADRLERVLVNLLDNALRHSRPGAAVELGLRTENSRARLTVDDRGPGVDPALAPHLFQRFVKTARGGGGSRFWFELPRAL